MNHCAIGLDLGWEAVRDSSSWSQRFCSWPGPLLGQRLGESRARNWLCNPNLCSPHTKWRVEFRIEQFWLRRAWWSWGDWFPTGPRSHRPFGCWKGRRSRLATNKDLRTCRRLVESLFGHSGRRLRSLRDCRKKWTRLGSRNSSSKQFRIW